MEDYLLDSMGRALVSLARYGPPLCELVTPRRAPAGGEGKPSSHPGSRPPVSVPMLDFVAETESVLGRWCGVLVMSSPGQGPAPSREDAGCLIAHRADWLRSRLDVIEQMPWARRCADEVLAQARLVADVVAPAPSGRDPDPIEFGTARQVEQWSRVLGRPISRSRIQRAIAAGDLDSEMMPDGRVLVCLADALALSPIGGLGSGPPQVLS